VRLVSLVPQRETLEQVFLRQVRGTQPEEPRSAAVAGGKR
jgi:hypothetical protein